MGELGLKWAALWPWPTMLLSMAVALLKLLCRFCDGEESEERVEEPESDEFDPEEAKWFCVCSRSLMKWGLLFSGL